MATKLKSGTSARQVKAVAISIDDLLNIDSVPTVGLKPKIKKPVSAAYLAGQPAAGQAAAVEALPAGWAAMQVRAWTGRATVTRHW